MKVENAAQGFDVSQGGKRPPAPVLFNRNVAARPALRVRAEGPGHEGRRLTRWKAFCCLDAFSSSALENGCDRNNRYDLFRRWTVRSRGRGRRSIIGGLFVYAVGLMATLAWFIFYHFPRTSVDGPAAADAAEPVNHYAGSIAIPIGTGRRCRHMTFDNNTGSLQESGVSTCRDQDTSLNSTEGRMNAIRHSFSGK